MKYLSLLAIAGVFLFSVACTPKKDDTTPPAEDQTITITVEGMKAEATCPAAVETMLKGVTGVTEAKVDFTAKEATVTAGKDVKPEDVAAALKDPYSGTVKK